MKFPSQFFLWNGRIDLNREPRAARSSNRPVRIGPRFSKGDPLVSPDFFENAMAHPRMKVKVLGSSKLPLAKNNSGEKSVGKHDLFLSFFSKIFFPFFFNLLSPKFGPILIKIDT